MKSTAAHVEALYEKAKTYTNTSLELYKLNAIDTTADIVSSLASRAALLLVISLFTLFVNVALSLLIGKALGEAYLGFLVISGFYLLVAFFLYVFGKKYIKIPITNLLIAKLSRTNANKEPKKTENNGTV